MKYTFYILALVLILHTLAGRTFADTSVIWETRSLLSVTSNSHPSLHGMCLVWQAKGGLAGTASAPDDWEIFVYDLTSRTVTQLTDDAFDDILPKTDGTYIVWQKHYTVEGNQIFLYQLGTTPLGGNKISNAVNADHFSPDIAEGNVIWSRQQVDQSFLPREILLYNAKMQTGPLVISNPLYYSTSPRISGNLIVFQQENQVGPETLLLIYDVNDEPPVVAKPAQEDFIWSANPQVDGEQTVLSRYNGTDREIYLHTPSDGYTQITQNDLDDTCPVISQNHIAWTTNNDIFLAGIGIISPAPVSRFFWPMFYPAMIGAGRRQWER